jgi:hypothetical protein
MHTVLSWIWIISGELVQLASEMFSSPRVVVPVCVNAIDSSKVCTFVAMITAVTAVSTVGAIIFNTPPAVTGRVPVNVTYLTGDIDIGRGATIATTTTIITAATIIIIAAGAVIIIAIGAVITVLLARAVLAPAIIIARPLIMAWTAVFIAGALLLALVWTWKAIIIAWTSIAASHVS